MAGTAVSALTGSPDYPNNPTGTELIATFEGPTDWADTYGTRLYGWLTPPQSGDYTFWIASDDGGELWLSTDADPANAVVIAHAASWTNSQEWGKEAGRRNRPRFTLQAGQEVLRFRPCRRKRAAAITWPSPGKARASACAS